MWAIIFGKFIERSMVWTMEEPVIFSLYLLCWSIRSYLRLAVYSNIHLIRKGTHVVGDEYFEHSTIEENLEDFSSIKNSAEIDSTTSTHLCTAVCVDLSVSIEIQLSRNYQQLNRLGFFPFYFYNCCSALVALLTISSSSKRVLSIQATADNSLHVSRVRQRSIVVSFIYLVSHSTCINYWISHFSSWLRWSYRRCCNRSQPKDHFVRLTPFSQ